MVHTNTHTDIYIYIYVYVYIRMLHTNIFIQSSQKVYRIPGIFW